LKLQGGKGPFTFALDGGAPQKDPAFAGLAPGLHKIAIAGAGYAETIEVWVAPPAPALQPSASGNEHWSRLFAAPERPKGGKSQMAGNTGMDDSTGAPTQINGLVMHDGTLYFAAFTPASGGELWRSQGFAADTEIVVEMQAGSAGGNPDHIRDAGPFGGGILFAAETVAAGQELFTSSGASGNFQLVSNFAAGAASSFPKIHLVNGFVAFVSADTAGAGREPWMAVDVGATYAEVALGDLNPGGNGSDPSVSSNCVPVITAAAAFELPGYRA